MAKLTERRERIDKRLSTVDTLVAFVVQKRICSGTSVAKRKQFLQKDKNVLSVLKPLVCTQTFILFTTSYFSPWGQPLAFEIFHAVQLILLLPSRRSQTK